MKIVNITKSNADDIVRLLKFLMVGRAVLFKEYDEGQEKELSISSVYISYTGNNNSCEFITIIGYDSDGNANSDNIPIVDDGDINNVALRRLVIDLDLHNTTIYIIKFNNKTEVYKIPLT